MKNHNHDLVQALHHTLDNQWRVKEYKKNAEGCTHCASLWDKFETHNAELAELISGEISRHSKEDRFN